MIKKVFQVRPQARFFFFSSRRRHTRCSRDWSSDLCSSDLVEHDIGQSWIRVGGRAVVTLLVFAAPEAPPLLGAYALEGLRLAPDPIGRRLVPVPGLLMEFVT